MSLVNSGSLKQVITRKVECKFNLWDFLHEIHFVCMQNNLILTDIISKLGLLDYYECALLHKLLRPEQWHTDSHHLTQ